MRFSHIVTLSATYLGFTKHYIMDNLYLLPTLISCILVKTDHNNCTEIFILTLR